MRKNILLVTFLAFIIGSCCKGPYPIASISVSYTSLSTSSDLKAYLTNRNDLSTYIDTIILGELNNNINYQL